MRKDSLKKLFIILGLVGTGIGSIMNIKSLIIIGTLLGIIGALMLIGVIK